MPIYYDKYARLDVDVIGTLRKAKVGGCLTANCYTHYGIGVSEGLTRPALRNTSKPGS